MSLRARLFLLFGGLLAVLLGAQWWMLHALASDLDAEVTALAVEVGESIVSILEDQPLRDEGGTARRVQVEVVPKDPPGTTEGKELTRVIRLVREKGESEDTEREIYHLDGPPVDEPGQGFLSPRLLDQVHLPVHSVNERLRLFSNRMLAYTGGLLLLGLAVAGFAVHRITRPLRHLATAAGQVGEGELGVRVEVSAGGEVGETVRAFNRMSDRLRELEEDARRLRADRHLKELGEVSRGLAHSLRNPLNALGLSVERLAEGGLEPADRQHLATTARQQIRRVDSSLRSFLALASSGAVAEEDVDVAALIQDVALEALQASRATAGPETPPRLETDLEAGLPTLRAVRPELRAVLQTLVVNALEASPAGGRVRLRAASDDSGALRIEVEDEGPGLPAEVRRQLFSPHVTTKEQGSGMGLFLAQRIAVNRYGGSLRLEDLDPGAEGPKGTRAVLEVGPRAPRREGEPRGAAS